jgi:hypothetical protein
MELAAESGGAGGEQNGILKPLSEEIARERLRRH